MLAVNRIGVLHIEMLLLSITWLWAPIPSLVLTYNIDAKIDIRTTGNQTLRLSSSTQCHAVGHDAQI
jgi:hypothetical protein